MRVLILTVSISIGCTGGGGGPGADDRDGATRVDGSTESGSDGSLPDSPLCRSSYPAQPCDGDPHGEWTLAAVCLNAYEDCRGARVKTTGSAAASIAFNEGWPEAQFEYSYDFDLETRLSVPASCLGGKSCETIGCFAGDDPCSCILGSSSGGSTSASWTPNITGEVVTSYPGGSQMTSLRFCAGANTADSLIGGRRIVWERVCTENMDCRPSDPCHVGKAHCGSHAITCEDTGAARAVGTACGIDEVCAASGACVACSAGAECDLEGQPCKRGVISCASAEPVCVAKGNREDGAACGDDKHCSNGVCKAEDGAPCTSDSECEDSCTCGDPQCLTRYCGRSCECEYAPPGGACAGNLEDGTRDPSACDKVCFRGRCLTEVGQRCTRDAECGSGHCTCWLSTCSGGRLCSKSACLCQWASSGSDGCSGPLMDGLGDLSCAAPQMCTQGMCQ